MSPPVAIRQFRIIMLDSNQGEPLPPILLGGLTYSLERAWRTLPPLRPEHVAPRRVPLGRSPSLHRLRGRLPGVVRRLLRYYGTVRLPASVHHRIASLDFPVRPAAPSASGGRGISRLPCIETCAADVKAPLFVGARSRMTHAAGR